MAPLSDTWCSSIAPHCLAGLREVPAEVPTLVLAPRCGLFVPRRACAFSGSGCTQRICAHHKTLRFSESKSSRRPGTISVNMSIHMSIHISVRRSSPYTWPVVEAQHGLRSVCHRAMCQGANRSGKHCAFPSVRSHIHRSHIHRSHIHRSHITSLAHNIACTYGSTLPMNSSYVYVFARARPWPSSGNAQLAIDPLTH